MPVPIESIPLLVKKLYKIVKEFEELFPERRFTPDGHLVGSIGEVIAAHRYGLTLVSTNERGHDAITDQNLCVEVKSTYTLGVKKDKVLIKHQAVKALGYLCEIWVYDNKGNRLEVIS